MNDGKPTGQGPPRDLAEETETAGSDPLGQALREAGVIDCPERPATGESTVMNNTDGKKQQEMPPQTGECPDHPESNTKNIYRTDGREGDNRADDLDDTTGTVIEMENGREIPSMCPTRVSTGNPGPQDTATRTPPTTGDPTTTRGPSESTPPRPEAHTDLTFLVNTMGQDTGPPEDDQGEARPQVGPTTGRETGTNKSTEEALTYFEGDDDVFLPPPPSPHVDPETSGLPPWMHDRELLKADRDAQDEHYQRTDPASPVPWDHPCKPALDILDRVLVHMYDEEDCLRAETSRVLEEEEVRDLLEKRGNELSLTCDAPITITEPDVTSTPRADRGGEQVNGAKATEGEILRANTMEEPSVLEGDADEEMPETGEEGEIVEDTHQLSQHGGLELDAAGIGALASSLQQSIGDGSTTQGSGGTADPETDKERPASSTPKDKTKDGRPSGREDDGGDENNESEGLNMSRISTTSKDSRKRGRGGRRHKQTESGGGKNKDEPAKQSRRDESSARGPGRPPGSGNKKFTKERSSSRQRGEPAPEPAGLGGDRSRSRDRGREDTGPGTERQESDRERGRRRDGDGYGNDQQPRDQERRDREERERRQQRDAKKRQEEERLRDERERQRQRRQAWADEVGPTDRAGTGAGAQEPTNTHNNADAPNREQPSSAPTWATTEEVEAISEAITLCSAGGGAEHFAADEPGLEVVQAPPVAAPMFNLDQSFDLDESRVFDCRDLVSSAIEIHRGNQVRTRNIVQFVLLARKKTSAEREAQNPLEVSSDSSTGDTTPNGDEANDQHEQDANNNGGTAERNGNKERGRPAGWMVPEPMIFHDVVNRVECEMAKRKLACLKAQKWANLWGRVGLLGLSAKNPDDIRQFREVIEGLADPRLRFTIFPRDAVDKRGSISVLLRETFRAMDPLCLPQILFARNRGLGGSLKVTHIKSYNNGEKTRAGVTKKHWRLILLQGCATFMKSLENFDEDHKFHVGSGHVYISGGARRTRSERQGTRPSNTTTGPNGGGNRGSGSGQHQHERAFPRLTSGSGGNRSSRHDEGDNNQSRRDSRTGTSRRMDPPPRRP